MGRALPALCVVQLRQGASDLARNTCHGGGHRGSRVGTKGTHCLMPDLRQDRRYSKFLEYHRGLHFRHGCYTSEHEGDDDHCIACWQKLAKYGGPEIQHDGYVTPYIVEYPREGPVTQYRWVCNACWADFRDFMDWKED